MPNYTRTERDLLAGGLLLFETNSNIESLSRAIAACLLPSAVLTTEVELYGERERERTLSPSPAVFPK